MAVWRPGRRDDRVGTGQRDLATFPIGIGDAQAVATTGLGHIGHAGGEDAALAGQLQIDCVGNPMRREPHVIGRHRIGFAAEVLAFHHIPELEAQVDPAIGQAADRARRQGIGVAGAPITPGRQAGLRQARRRIDDAELSAALEIGADDRSHRLAAAGFVDEIGQGHRHLRAADTRDFDTKLGHGRQAQQRGCAAQQGAARQLGQRLEKRLQVGHGLAIMAAALSRTSR